MEKKVIYYSDELNDEFSDAKIKTKIIDEHYQYIHKSVFKKIYDFILLRIVFYPFACLYLKFKFKHKIVNKKLLYKEKRAYFIYGNHTQPIGDAFIPPIINKKNTYVIVHANNVSMPVLGKMTPSLGALPLPANAKAYKNFIRAIDFRIKQNRCVTIYPEAHIWPYYTKIRPFVDTSFNYPVKYNTPTYCFTNTYQKYRKNKVRIVTYIDGPFYFDSSLSLNEAKKQLRDQVYNKMVERSKNSNIEVIKYIKKEEQAND